MCNSKRQLPKHKSRYKKLSVQNWLCAGSKEYHRSHTGYGNPPTDVNKSATLPPPPAQNGRSVELSTYPYTMYSINTHIHTYVIT